MYMCFACIYACMFVCALCACLAPMGATVVTDGGKLTCGPWEPSLGPVKEQQVLLPAEPPLHGLTRLYLNSQGYSTLVLAPILCHVQSHMAQGSHSPDFNIATFSLLFPVTSALHLALLSFFCSLRFV